MEEPTIEAPGPEGADLTPWPPLAARVGLPAVSELLIRALTHSSFAHEHPPAEHNETLAFLGDAVLGLAVADLLVRRAPGAAPGTLTVQRAEIVSTGGLAAWARRWVSARASGSVAGRPQHGGRDKDSVSASAFEAVAGVLYLAGGLPAVLRLVERLLADGVARPEADGDAVIG